nr:deoxyguanosinetriphosphate triphosphohydrolase [uncultured Sellimonas sp.]
MEWSRLLSPKRERTGRKHKEKNRTDLRSSFEKDYHRIIGSASFRRLQDKTQVFPLDRSDFVRTRLTHSLEVSSFGKSLGQNIGEYILTYGKDPEFTPQMKEDICNILLCAGLIHDIGNPPFGHFGETTIREWFEEHLTKLTYHGAVLTEVLTPRMLGDLYYFEGNAQAFRLVTRLHYLVDETGMNLTYALLNTIVKYPVDSLHVDPDGESIQRKKLGYYLADEELFFKISRETGTEGKRHPLTFILEAADDIAYKTADIEDAFVKGFLPFTALARELEGLDTGENFQAYDHLMELYHGAVERAEEEPEAYAVKNWIVRVQSFLIACATEGFTENYEAIMCGEYQNDLFAGTKAERLMEILGHTAEKYVFLTDEIYKMEVAESRILSFLLEKFVTAAVRYSDPDQKMDSIDRRMLAFISDNYKKAYLFSSQGKGEIEKLYLRILLVTDYICGMTDSYAKRLYQELTARI